MNRSRNDMLQALCRSYLYRLRYMARKHGLGVFVRDMIMSNRRGECKATEYEVGLLSRMCDDERISRADVPSVLGRSYRECHERGLFDRLRRLRHTGIYSKVSALLLGSELKSLYDGD